MKLFVDTWGWMTLAEPLNREHAAALQCYEEYSRSGRVVTSNYVLDESLTLIFRRLRFDAAYNFSKALLESSFVAVETVTEARFRSAFELRGRFADKPNISFTDLTSIVIMTELKMADILTADAHFAHVGMGFQLLPS
ncbi:MAG: PIN domain-containing protein [Candidatus Acidiferrales bacterium]